jgi:hypothetical protein
VTRRALHPSAVLLLLVAIAGTTSRGTEADVSIPAPAAFFGFAMGADRRVADWTRTAEYLRLVDRLSDRVVVEDLGPTTDGHPYLAAVVSTPDTIARLDHYKDVQRRLADPRQTSDVEARALARAGKVVVLIGGAVHANELGSTQMMNDLVHELATATDGWVPRVLDRAIVVLVPAQNPDGLQMMAEWHAAHVGTPWEDAPLPELYHRYAGHDLNRDAYMLTQPESRYLARLLYREWLPEVYLDQHQMGSDRARIFVPPFRNPPNPNIDPLVWSQVNLLGQAMAARLHEDGKTGVLWGEVYSGFWQGANSTAPWWHNIVALLSEVASARLSAPVYQRPTPGAALGEPPQPGDTHLPPPTDLQFRMNYPDPWQGGRWTFHDVVTYHRLAAVGLLEAAANQAEMLKRNFHAMNRRTVERFANGRPAAFLVPANQRDPPEAAELVRLLQAGGAEVHRASAPFTADGVEYPAGTAIVWLAQAFGRWVKDLLEPQVYPEIRWPSPSAPVDRPYDMTAWTLGMLMGVRVVEVQAPFEARATLLVDETRPAAGSVHGQGDVMLIPAEPNAGMTAAMRLLEAGAHVSWTSAGFDTGDAAHAPGTLVVRNASREAAATLARDLGFDVRLVAEADVTGRLVRLRRPRVAVYEPWGGSIDAGWTRWVLEQHEVPFTRIRHTEVLADDFPGRFDVVILPDLPATLLLRGLQGGGVRPEHRGGLGDHGIARLRAFVDDGGTLVTLGNGALFAIDALGLPLRNVVRDEPHDAFFCPGSILRLHIDTSHPLGYGLPPEAHAMFVNNGGYVAAGRGSEAVTIVARYPDEPLLRSGWIVGESQLRSAGAVAEVALGRGRVLLLTFRVQHRAQTRGTFKLLFNSILYGPAAAATPAGPPTQQE